MSDPIPGLTIQINAVQQQEYFDYDERTVRQISSLKEITNYEYEEKENENKRKILILKKEYLPLFLDNFKKAMRYDKSSQYIDNKNKKANNPNI